MRIGSYIHTQDKLVALQVELPPMACFTLELGDQAPDPQQVLEEMAAERREKERLLYVKRIRKMYNLAQSHKAATHR
jgi:hypothetical protein